MITIKYPMMLFLFLFYYISYIYALTTNGSVLLLTLNINNMNIMDGLTTNISLQEYTYNTTATTYIQSIPISSDYNIDPQPIIPSINATLNSTSINLDKDSRNTILTVPYMNYYTDYHGQLDRTSDARYIMFAGYNTSIGTNLNSSSNTKIARVVAIMDYHGNVTFTAAIRNISWYAYNVASDNGQRYWIAAGKSGGFHVPANYGDKSIAVNVFTNEYRSYTVNNGGLYASRPTVQIQQFGLNAAFLPVGTISDDTAVGTGTFLDTRGQAWRTSTDLWVVDVQQGLMHYTKFGTNWNKYGPFKAGSIYQFIDCTMDSSNNYVLVITNTSLYSFTVATTTFTNNNVPIATAVPGTTWRGVSLSPWVPPSASPTASPTPSITSTPSLSPTSSLTPSPSATLTPSGTGTTTMTPTALATIDYVAIVRLANEQAAAKRTELGLIAGGTIGGLLLLVGGIYIFKMHQQKQLKLKRLKKLQSSAELARLGPTSMLSNARLTANDHGSKYIGAEDDDPEYGGPAPPKNDVVMYQLGPNKAALTSNRINNVPIENNNGKSLTGRGNTPKSGKGRNNNTITTNNPYGYKR